MTMGRGERRTPLNEGGSEGGREGGAEVGSCQHCMLCRLLLLKHYLHTYSNHTEAVPNQSSEVLLKYC